jgi:hypothetical protein
MHKLALQSLIHSIKSFRNIFPSYPFQSFGKRACLLAWPSSPLLFWCLLTICFIRYFHLTAKFIFKEVIPSKDFLDVFVHPSFRLVLLQNGHFTPVTKYFVGLAIFPKNSVNLALRIFERKYSLHSDVSKVIISIRVKTNGTTIWISCPPPILFLGQILTGCASL